MTTADQTKRIGIALEETARDQHMDQGRRESVMDLLITAGTALDNGNVLDAVGGIVVFLSRDARYSDGRVSKVVDAHTAACPLRGAASGRYAALYPYRWPLVVLICVALISPYAGPVLARAIERHIDAGIHAAAKGAITP